MTKSKILLRGYRYLCKHTGSYLGHAYNNVSALTCYNLRYAYYFRDKRALLLISAF